MSKSKEAIQAALGLATVPDDAFVALLTKVGDADLVAGPRRSHAVRAYAPDEIEKIVLEGAVGSLLAHARDESKRSLNTVGTEAGVSRARVQQIEHSDNIEIATLSPGMRAFSTVLRGTTR